MSQQTCPVCGEIVSPNASECPNCGSVLSLPEPAVIISPKVSCPYCHTESELGAVFCSSCGKPLRKEVSTSQESVDEVKPKESRTFAKGIKISRRPKAKPSGVLGKIEAKVQQEESRSSEFQLKVPSIGAVDTSCPGICIHCGHGISDLEQRNCPACGFVLDAATVTAQRDAFFIKAETFVAVFDREENLPQTVLAYLYRKQVKPALLREYETLLEKWKKIVELCIVAVPGYLYDKLPAKDEILLVCRSLFELARLWTSEAVNYYIVLEQDRLEANSYIHDLIARAYQLLGTYHTCKALENVNPSWLLDEYEAGQRNYVQAQRTLQAASNFSIVSSEDIQQVVSVGISLLSMVLSYPNNYERVGKDNPILPEFSISFDSYQSYLTVYPSLKDLVERSHHQLQDTAWEIQRSLEELAIAVEVGERENQNTIKRLEAEKLQESQKWEEIKMGLTTRRKKILLWARLMPLLAFFILIGLTWLIFGDEFVDVSGLTFAIAFGTIGFTYLEGLLDVLKKLPVWAVALKWIFIVELVVALIFTLAEFS